MDNSLSHAVENFNRLVQERSLEDYIDSFESTRALLEMHAYELSFKFVLDSFIGGLKDSLKPFVKVFNPKTFPLAIRYARLQQESLDDGHSSKPNTLNSTANHYVLK